MDHDAVPRIFLRRGGPLRPAFCTLARKAQDMNKIDLHIHLPGTVRAETFAELSAANNIDLPMPAAELYRRINSDPTDEEQERGPWFPLLRVYELISASLRTRDDFARVVFEALEDGYRESSTIYTELAFSPSVHTDLGVAYRDMAAGIADGFAMARERLGVDGRAIAAVNREDTPEKATAMVEAVLDHRSDDIVGVGIDFFELKGMPEKFAEAFQLAGRHGLSRTAHAGEHAPTAETVRTCLELLGCDRIDHGYQILRDPEIVARCRDAGVFFNVAFTTSRRALIPWRRESIEKMDDAGLRVTINSDDPALFPTTLEREYAIATEVFGAARLPEFVANAVDATFLGESEREVLRQRTTDPRTGVLQG
ncbi:adenosine deaminase [Saxibacter everestensis]|uniref:Adenosine deaminase n=1 Tax=Saxibacter everestensis TaxID=2909229 RepID=A0ABY8QNS0_9MICO|nr:adenosine deaminase [Brevibacteriaceae bacterium ZFBP1038]